MGGWAHTHARPSRAAPSTAFALPYSILATLSSISEMKILASPSYQGVCTRAVWLCGPHSCLPHCDLYFIRSPAAAVKLTPSRGDGMSSKLTTIFRAFRGKAPGRAADLHSVTRLDINTGIACCLLYTDRTYGTPTSVPVFANQKQPKENFHFYQKRPHVDTCLALVLQAAELGPGEPSPSRDWLSTGIRVRGSQPCEHLSFIPIYSGLRSHDVP